MLSIKPTSIEFLNLTVMEVGTGVHLLGAPPFHQVRLRNLGSQPTRISAAVLDPWLSVTLESGGTSAVIASMQHETLVISLVPSRFNASMLHRIVGSVVLLDFSGATLATVRVAVSMQRAAPPIGDSAPPEPPHNSVSSAPTGISNDQSRRPLFVPPQKYQDRMIGEHDPQTDCLPTTLEKP